jgi:FixJ family two-component response regulator
LKVLYVSGYSAELSSQEFPADSITFLAKPFPAHELARAIRACLDQPARGKT